MMWRWAWSVAAALPLLGVSVSSAEVSVDSPEGASGRGPGVVVIAARGHGGPVPWGAVRRGIPASWILNPEGDVRGDGEPAVTLQIRTGVPQVVWATRTGSDFDIVHSEWTGSGWSTWSTVAGGSAVQRGADVAALAGGVLAVVWWEDDGVFEQVFLRRRDGAGVWQAIEPVSPTTEPASWPAVAASPDGLWVAWLRDRGDGTRDVVVAFEPDAWDPVEIGTTSHVTGDGGIDAELALHSREGRVWADWLLAPDRLATSRLDAVTGRWSAVEEIPCEDSPEGRDAARFEARRRALGW